MAEYHGFESYEAYQLAKQNEADRFVKLQPREPLVMRNRQLEEQLRSEGRAVGKISDRLALAEKQVRSLTADRDHWKSLAQQYKAELDSK